MNEMKPWMQDDQIELVERILLSFGKRKLNILEWGSGGSTLYFSQLLEKHGIDYEWISVEHSSKWYNQFIGKVPQGKIKVILKKQKAGNPATINLDHYVHYPRELTNKNKPPQFFDFILVDGRARARCLVEAKFLVKPDGIIMLHDAEREKYHYVFPLFENGKFIYSKDKPHAIWVTGNIERAFNAFMNKADFFSQLKKLIQNETPFCFLRFGDGEGLFAFTDWNMPELYKEMCMKHWGEIPEKQEQEILTQNLQTAYQLCDIAGIPPQTDILMNFKSDLWIKTNESFLNLHNHTSLVSMDIHIDMVQEKFLEEIMKGRNVFYVACRNIDSYLLENGAKKAEHILVSPQYKYEKDKPQEKLYKQIPAIKNKIEQKNLKGWVCLLGAGVAGKTLGITMKNQGGMVIDAGSIFDLWAGVKSRTWIKKINKL